MMKIYHGTSVKRCIKILTDGYISERSCWGTFDMANYFGGLSANEDNSPMVLLVLDIDNSNIHDFDIDEQMLDFPMCDVIGVSDHGMLESEWDESEQTWKDCLEIYHSVVLTRQTKIDIHNIELESRSLLPSELTMPRVIGLRKKSLCDDGSPSP